MCLRPLGGTGGEVRPGVSLKTLCQEQPQGMKGTVPGL